MIAYVETIDPHHRDPEWVITSASTYAAGTFTYGIFIPEFCKGSKVPLWTWIPTWEPELAGPKALKHLTIVSKEAEPLIKPYVGGR